MNKYFDRAFEFIMRWEGYKSENPDDPGGRTIFGISERFFPRIVAKLWDLSYDDARAGAKVFYWDQFWKEAGCDDLQQPMDLAVFDTAVNMGIATSLKLLKDCDGSVFEFLVERIRAYVKLAKQGQNIIFLRGWINRVLSLYEAMKKPCN